MLYTGDDLNALMLSESKLSQYISLEDNVMNNWAGEAFENRFKSTSILPMATFISMGPV